MNKICGLSSSSSIAIMTSEGDLLDTYKKAFWYPAANSEQSSGENRIKNKVKVTYPYKDFEDLPSSLEKVPFYLKYGHFGKAYRKIYPFLKSSSQKLKDIAAKTMERIKRYQDGLLNDINTFIEESRIDEAYRLASNALDEFKGVRGAFVDNLKEVTKKYRKDARVRKLERAGDLFKQGMKQLRKGKLDYAIKYFESIADNFPDTYYGKQAENLLKIL